MRFSGFHDVADRLINHWTALSAANRLDPRVLSATVRERLRPNMILSLTDIRPDDPMDFHVKFLHRYAIPSGILKVLGVGEVQCDQYLRDFKDQEYLRKSVISQYCEVREAQRPRMDQVSSTMFGFKILYDRVLLPQVNPSGRSEWCLSLTETRLVLPLPGHNPKLDAHDLRVLQLLHEGGSAKEIGESTGLSPRTVEHRIDRLKKKFEARNIAHLVALSITYACAVSD